MQELRARVDPGISSLQLRGSLICLETMSLARRLAICIVLHACRLRHLHPQQRLTYPVPWHRNPAGLLLSNSTAELLLPRPLKGASIESMADEVVVMETGGSTRRLARKYQWPVNACFFSDTRTSPLPFLAGRQVQRRYPRPSNNHYAPDSAVEGY